MDACKRCSNAEIVMDTDAGLCLACWWRWWFEPYSRDDLIRLIETAEPEVAVEEDGRDEKTSALLELELRRIEATHVRLWCHVPLVIAQGT